MAWQRIGVLLPESTGTSDAEFASTAEGLGYESIWVGENWGRNAFLRLATVVRETEDIGIGTAITNVYSRTPATVAMTGVNLDERSEGRFRLGVGPSSPALVEDLHGMSFDRPVRRTHETVELVQAFTRTDDRVSYSGELFEVSGFRSLDRPFPIYNAAIGAANRRATGRLCDGWLPHLVPFSRLEESFETVATAADGADRDPTEITVAPYLPAAVSEDVARARDAVARHVAFYVGSSDSFRRAVAAAFPDEAGTVASLWDNGEREAAIDEVTDAMLADLSVHGTPAEARTRLQAVLDLDVVDVPLVALPAGVEESLVERTVRELAPRHL